MSPVRAGQRCVVVTGASTGIGLGTVGVLVQQGYHVCGSVRKAADGERLQDAFGTAFTPLLFDITEEAAVKAAAMQVREMLAGSTLFGLVNNAGVAFHGPLAYQPVAEFRQNLEVNLIGTLIVTQAFLPLLGTDSNLAGPPGRIIMISSVSGRFAGPFLGSYVASKHGLEGMAASLRRELMLFSIDVIIIGPGTVVTPVWDKAEARDISCYDSTPYKAALAALGVLMVRDGRTGHSPEHTGRAILNALTARWPATRYAIVHQKFTKWTMPLILPPRWVDYLVASHLKLLPSVENKQPEMSSRLARQKAA